MEITRLIKFSRFLGTIALAAITAAATSCGGNADKGSADNSEEQPLPILGTWRYASMTYIVPGDKPDTVSMTFGPDTIQIYDVYRNDSILESYLPQGDSILKQVRMHYIFRNDSIIAENEETQQQVYVENATDSTLNFVFTKTHGDTTAYFKTLSERCELPLWLKKETNDK